MPRKSRLSLQAGYSVWIFSDCRLQRPHRLPKAKPCKRLQQRKYGYVCVILHHTLPHIWQALFRLSI